jgi:uncharacterized phage infection (PIP) family protein YhgE
MAKVEEKIKSTPIQVPKAVKGAAAATDMADSGSVDKIRDILFGNQMRDFERRFSQMEDRLVKATRDLRDETNKRLESLEHFFEKELDALKGRLKAEADERANGDKSLDDGVKNAANVLKKAIAQVEEKLSDHASDFRQQLLEQSKSLSSEIQSKNEKSAADLHARAGALDEAKIDRSTMAEYLIEMAMRLSNHAGDSPAANQEA